MSETLQQEAMWTVDRDLLDLCGWYFDDLELIASLRSMNPPSQVDAVRGRLIDIDVDPDKAFKEFGIEEVV